jgi:hypothetical protein
MFPCEGGFGGMYRLPVWEEDHLHCVVRSWCSVSPNGWHRTTKANIRFHLYGGPQGWNPHDFGLERSAFDALRASFRAS